MGRDRNEQARDDRAAKTLQRAISEMENADGFYNMAEALAQIGEFDAAIDCAQKIPAFSSYSRV